MKARRKRRFARYIGRTGLTLAICGTLGALGGCADRSPRKAAPVKEAYHLLDQGDRARAIAILEARVEAAPTDEEARYLLASAYVGEAGVDIYSLHQTFRDVLFNQPLGKRFFTPAAPAPSAEASPASAPTPPPASAVSPGNAALPHRPGAVPGAAPSHDPHASGSPLVSQSGSKLMEGLILSLDNVLSAAQKTVSFLDRFPKIDEARWTLLDRALDQLNRVRPSRDVRLYRVFIRVVYLRSYLGVKLFANAEIGSKEWACQLNPDQLRDILKWSSRLLHDLTTDFRATFPNRTTSFFKVEEQFNDATRDWENADAIPLPGAPIGLQAFQTGVRERFGCPMASPTPSPSASSASRPAYSSLP